MENMMVYADQRCETMKVYVDQNVYIKVFNLGPGVSALSPLHSKVYQNWSYFFSDYGKMRVYVDQFCGNVKVYVDPCLMEKSFISGWEYHH